MPNDVGRNVTFKDREVVYRRNWAQRDGRIAGVKGSELKVAKIVYLSQGLGKSKQEYPSHDGAC